MKETENNLLDPLLERLEDYGKTSLELIKLRAIDKASDTVSEIVPKTVVVWLVLTFLLFLSIGIALWLGETWGHYYLGFLAIAVFYAILGFLIYFTFRRSIKESIRNAVIKQLQK